MCQQQNKANKMKLSTTTYSIKKVLKALFKKQQKQQKQQLSNSLESFESLDNIKNCQVEQQFYDEIEDNTANEKLMQCSVEYIDIADNIREEDIYVPVRFARTEVGTFFWTTNLQPVVNTIVPAADEDLVRPAYCYSNYQQPSEQFQDRWAQA